MTEPVLLTRNGPIAEVTLNRPEKHNAANLDLLDALVSIGEALQADTSLRAVVLHGAGENFCSGIDTSLFTANPDPKALIGQILDTTPKGNRFQRPTTVWQDLEVPVIAALHGACFGAGLQIALGADIRLAAPDTRLSIMEIKWGLIPDMGLTATLPRLIRADVAKELFMTGRIVNVEEAQRIGLVTRMAEDPLAEARALAETIAGKNPDAIRRNKRLVNETWGSGRAEALALEAELQAQVIGQKNQLEAVFAQMQKRAPQFT
jgi:enoyl-CoA hydratase/carnithine racemase